MGLNFFKWPNYQTYITVSNYNTRFKFVCLVLFQATLCNLLSWFIFNNIEVL